MWKVLGTLSESNVIWIFICIVCCCAVIYEGMSRSSVEMHSMQCLLEQRITIEFCTNVLKKADAKPSTGKKSCHKIQVEVTQEALGGSRMCSRSHPLFTSRNGRKRHQNGLNTNLRQNDWTSAICQKINCYKKCWSMNEMSIVFRKLLREREREYLNTNQNQNISTHEEPHPQKLEWANPKQNLSFTSGISFIFQEKHTHTQFWF